MSASQALEYARKHGLEAVVIIDNGEIVAEEYDKGFSIDKAHALYSGTKSFWGPLALRAEEDGLLQLDEPVAETITEWRSDKAKSKITIRMLLSLTTGFGFGGLGNAVPLYDAAIATSLKNAPGTTFTYGGIPLQIFGALLSRKLADAKLHDGSPHEYLCARVLKPAGVSVASWRKLKDGTQPLPTGAFLTARAWLTYGTYIDQHRAEFPACFQGSSANPRYGLGWWLTTDAATKTSAMYASGSGGQGMYIVPSRALIAVHFGKSASYKHEVFLRRLLPK